MSDMEDDPNVMIDYEQEITFIRVIDTTFVPTTMAIKAEMIPVPDAPEEAIDIALSKVRFWLEAIVTRCIAFSRENEDVSKMLLDSSGRNQSGNLFLLTPSDPTDDHLAALFQSKMTALASKAIVFGAIEVKTNNMSGLTFRFIGDSDEVLPRMDDWVGERSFFPVPWWSRDDSSTLDVVPAADADLSVKPAWAYPLDFFDKVKRDQNDVVLRAEFRPHVIDGGKKDD